MIKQIFMTGAVVALMLAGCGEQSAQTDQPDTVSEVEARTDVAPKGDIGKSLVSEMSTLVDVLETVKDEATARAAAQEIAAIGKKMEALSKRVDTANRGTKISLMMQSNGDEFRQLQSRLGAEMARIAMTDPKLLKIIGDEMSQLGLQ